MPVAIVDVNDPSVAKVYTIPDNVPPISGCIEMAQAIVVGYAGARRKPEEDHNVIFA